MILASKRSGTITQAITTLQKKMVLMLGMDGLEATRLICAWHWKLPGGMQTGPGLTILPVE